MKAQDIISDMNVGTTEKPSLVADPNAATTSEATAVTESTATTDPATRVMSQTSEVGMGSFIQAHKSTLIKGGIAVGIVAAAGLLAKHVVGKKKRVAETAPAQPMDGQQKSTSVTVTASEFTGPVVRVEPEPATVDVSTRTEYLVVPKPTDEVLAEVKAFQDRVYSLTDANQVAEAWKDAVKTARVTGTFFGVPVRGFPGIDNVPYDRSFELCQAVNMAMTYWRNGGAQNTLDIECVINEISENGVTKVIPIHASITLPVK